MFVNRSPRAAAHVAMTSLAAAMLLGACATTGGTFRSGVADTALERPPYYAGLATSVIGADAGRIGHLPIAYQRGASQASIFDPKSGPGTPVGELLAEMNSYLDSLASAARISVRLLDASGRVAPPATPVQPPDVRFGCRTEGAAAGGDCEERDNRQALGRGGQQMLLTVGRPSASWIDWLREPVRVSGVERVLVLTLEVGQYWTRQTGLRGAKSVELGTGYTQQLPWLTSLEQPVLVLQLTGALMDTAGRALRIGAEGIVAKRTGLLISAIGGQELLSDSDVGALRTLVRDDLPGKPLAWRVAVQNLLAGLTGRAGTGAGS
jgi:hypothetical protein